MIRPPGLRGRLVLAFTLGALLVSTVFAIVTYLVAHSTLINQRERAAMREAYADARIVRDLFESAGANAGEVVNRLTPRTGTSILLRRSGSWYSSSLDTHRGNVPSAVKDALAAGGGAVSMRISTETGPALVVGIHLPQARADLFELISLDQLDDALRLLGVVLAGAALLTTGLGAMIGAWASRSVIRPLNTVAETAAKIARGGLDSRLPATRDPALASIVGSFNRMVDTLQRRIERDARLAADVSHELRSPLTTLVASVDLLERRREEMSPRSQEALTLLSAELERFNRLLDDLLQLSTLDVNQNGWTRVSLVDLLAELLAATGRPRDLLITVAEPDVDGDRMRLERIFGNLLDNADHHGRGVTAVRVDVRIDPHLGRRRAEVQIDDAGPGVPPIDRERIFERFATVGPRRSSSGTGLGLALVSEMVAGHHGTVWCTGRAAGGSRFVVSLPLAEADPTDQAEEPNDATEYREQEP